MSVDKTQAVPSTSPAQIRNWSVPAKAFVLGEYAAMAGGRSLVAPLVSRFEFSTAVDPVNEFGDTLSWGSPASHLLLYAAARGFSTAPFALKDPFQGRGGFGASTAHFGLIYRWVAEQLGWSLDWQAPYKIYREITGKGFTSWTRPSGADFVAQWQGGLSIFDPEIMGLQDVSQCRGWDQFLIFSATHQSGRKVQTHQHLAQLAENPPSDLLISALRSQVDLAYDSLLTGRTRELGASLTEYGNLLCQAGLELAATTRDKKSLLEHSAVLGVKGMGAMGADGLVVLVGGDVDRDANPDQKSAVLEMAKKMDLICVADGLKSYPGIES